MNLILISPSNLPNVLSLVYPKIEAATAYSVGKYTGTDVLRSIAAGTMQLWCAFDEDKENIQGIAITEIAVYPQRKVCRFLCATGEDLADWIDLIDGMEVWATNIGCDGFQAECRPGWEKLLRARGYTKSHVILNKEIGSCH